MLWFTLGLLTAVFFSLFHITTKKYVANADPGYFAYLVLVFVGLISFPFVLILWSHLVFNYYWLVGVIAIGVIVWFGRFFHAKSLKLEDVSKTAPLLTVTPLITLIIGMTGIFIARENPGLIGIIGVIVLVIGLYVFNLRKRQRRILEPFLLIFKNKGSLMMFSVALVFGLGSIIDKFIIVNSNVLSRLLFFSYFAILFQTIYFLIRDKSQFFLKAKDIVKNHWKGALIVTLTTFLFNITQMYGLVLTYTVYIIAVKRISAVFTVIIAYFLFKERKDFKTVLVGSILMVLGAILMLLK